MATFTSQLESMRKKKVKQKKEANVILTLNDEFVDEAGFGL